MVINFCRFLTIRFSVKTDQKAEIRTIENHLPPSLKKQLQIKTPQLVSFVFISGSDSCYHEVHQCYCLRSSLRVVVCQGPPYTTVRSLVTFTVAHTCYKGIQMLAFRCYIGRSYTFFVRWLTFCIISRGSEWCVGTIDPRFNGFLRIRPRSSRNVIFLQELICVTNVHPSYLGQRERGSGWRPVCRWALSRDLCINVWCILQHPFKMECIFLVEDLRG